MSNVEIHKVEVEVIDITEDGSVYIEDDGATLVAFFDDQEIDLRKPFRIDGLNIVQGENIISLPSQQELDYFKTQIKEKGVNHES